ncbi:hypothetical protein JXA80_10190 [bacterium]|nr:hypothetical protein [candidate division CSSED10-310 bacterium]
MAEEKETKASFFRNEWVVIGALFLIAFITGFFYIRDRLETASHASVVTDGGSTALQRSAVPGQGEAEDVH